MPLSRCLMDVMQCEMAQGLNFRERNRNIHIRMWQKYVMQCTVIRITNLLLKRS